MLIALLIISFCCQLNASEHTRPFRTFEIMHNLWQTVERQPPVNRQDLLKTGFDDENPLNPWGMETYCKNQAHDPLWQQFASQQLFLQHDSCFKNFLFALIAGESYNYNGKYKYARCLVANCVKNYGQSFIRIPNEDITDLVKCAACYNDSRMILLVKQKSIPQNYPLFLWDGIRNARNPAMADLLEAKETNNPQRWRPLPYCLMDQEFSSKLLDYWQSIDPIDNQNTILILKAHTRNGTIERFLEGPLLFQLICNAQEHSQEELQNKFEWLIKHTNPKVLTNTVDFSGNKTPLELATHLLESSPQSSQLQWLQQTLQAMSYTQLLLDKSKSPK